MRCLPCPAQKTKPSPSHFYRFRDIYLLTTAAEDGEFVPERAEGGLQGWVDCYGKSSIKGHLFCGGVGGPNEIADNAKLQEAFEMGKRVA